MSNRHDLVLLELTNKYLYMKKFIKTLFYIPLLVNTVIYSQVGIGTDSPHPSAALDLDVSGYETGEKKGLLLPRVALQSAIDIVTIPSPSPGLWVYNTANNGSGDTAVLKDHIYFWDGTKWTLQVTKDLVIVKSLPEIFQLAVDQIQNTPNIGNGTPIIVTFPVNSVISNTGNNITINANNTFTVNSDGVYEISGFINYNANAANSVMTNIIYTIQSSTDGGVNWADITKSSVTFGSYSAGSSRSVVIAPLIVSLSQGQFLRAVVDSSYNNHGGNSRISTPTGLGYSKVLKIHKL